MKITIEMNAAEARKSIERGDLLRLIDTCLEDLGAVKEPETPVPTHTTVINAPVGGLPEHPQYVPVETVPTIPYQPQERVVMQQGTQIPMQIAPENAQKYQQVPQNPVQITPQEMQYHNAPQQTQQFQTLPMMPENAQQMPYQHNQQNYTHQAPPPHQAPPQANGPGVEDIRSVLAAVMKMGGNDQIDALWVHFGVSKLTDLQPHQYAAAYAAATGLAQSMDIPF